MVFVATAKLVVMVPRTISTVPLDGMNVLLPITKSPLEFAVSVALPGRAMISFVVGVGARALRTDDGVSTEEDSGDRVRVEGVIDEKDSSSGAVVPDAGVVSVGADGAFGAETIGCGPVLLGDPAGDC